MNLQKRWNRNYSNIRINPPHPRSTCMVVLLLGGYFLHLAQQQIQRGYLRRKVRLLLKKALYLYGAWDWGQKVAFEASPSRVRFKLLPSRNYHTPNRLFASLPDTILNGQILPPLGCKEEQHCLLHLHPVLSRLSPNHQ